MKIQILKDGKLLSEYDIIKDSFTLGRSDDCDITILEDGIARKHIEFKKSGKESFSFVKKSKFGVLSKNGEATDKGTISGGDRLEVGDVIIALSQSENTIDVTDAGTSGTEEVPIVEDQEIIEQIEDTSAGKKNKSKEKEKASKKANSDFEFFTMTGKPEDFGKQDEEQDQAKAQEKQKEEKQKSKIVKKGTVVKEAEEEAKKGESSTIYGQPIEIVSRPEVGDATTVGPALLLYQLIVISGPYKDKTFSLEKDAVIIGRAKNADIVLIDDLVSREHTRMYRQGVNYYLIDLNSSNGTKVNGKKAQEPIALTSGDIIEIGSSTLRFMVMNPQVQGAQGIDMGPEDAKGNRPVIEKVAPILTDGDIKKIEKSFGYEEDKAPKKKKLLPIVILFAIAVIVVIFMIPGTKKEPAKKVEAPAQQGAQPAEPEKKEEVPETRCTEQGSFCQLPPGVQQQLLAEYDVGVKLFKNFQFELAEDRAQQILAKVPDWTKAKELLDLSGAEKDKLITQKKEEEETQVRKMLEEKLSVLVREAKELMRQEKYDKVKDVVSKIFEIDPNNQEAKKIVDKLEEMKAQREKSAQKKAEFMAALSKYKNALGDGKKFYERKEYMKAIETFQKCLALPPMESGDAKSVREECKKLMDDSNRLLRESITPELTVAEELFTSGQFREAIASYQRVLKIDYKNKTAKARIDEARRAITEDAKESYSRAAIAESVSDFKNACLLYYKVVQIAIPGSKYYTDSLSKTKKLCNKDKSGEAN